MFRQQKLWDDEPTGLNAYGKPRTPEAASSPSPVGAAHNGTPTSIAAARSVAGIAGEMRRRVYDYIADRGFDGATAHEIELGLSIGGSSIRPRLIELERDNFITCTEVTRPTASGRQACVYVAGPNVPAT